MWHWTSECGRICEQWPQGSDVERAGCSVDITGNHCRLPSVARLVPCVREQYVWLFGALTTPTSTIWGILYPRRPQEQTSRHSENHSCLETQEHPVGIAISKYPCIDKKSLLTHGSLPICSLQPLAGQGSRYHCLFVLKRRLGDQGVVGIDTSVLRSRGKCKRVNNEFALFLKMVPTALMRKTGSQPKLKPAEERLCCPGPRRGFKSGR